MQSLTEKTIDTATILQDGLKEAALQIQQCTREEHEWISFWKDRAHLSIAPVPSCIVNDLTKDIKKLNKVCSRYLQSSCCVTVSKKRTMFNRPSPKFVHLPDHMKQLKRGDIEVAFAIYERLFLVLDKMDWVEQIKVSLHD